MIVHSVRLAGQVKDPNAKSADRVGGQPGCRDANVSLHKPLPLGHGAPTMSNASYPVQYWSGNSSYRVVFMILNTQDSSEQMFNVTERRAIRSG
jgi:hypothetical protein